MDSRPAASGRNRPLIALIVAFVAISTSYSFATRLKYGPDEPAHFIYIRSLATGLALPEIAHEETPTEDSTASHEGHQPPLYYAIMAIPYAILDALGVGSDGIWRVLRLLTITFGVLWVVGVYWLSKDYFRGEGYGLATAAFAAMIPTAPYVSGVVNNEMLISALFTWSLIPMLAYFRNGTLPGKSAAWLGALIGLAMLAKAQGLALAPLFLLAAIAVCRRQGYSNWKDVLRVSATVLGVAALVGGWWFVRCWYAYGTPMPHSLYRPVLSVGLVGLLYEPAQSLKLTISTTSLLYGYFWTPFWLVDPFVVFMRYLGWLLVPTAAAAVGLLIRLRRNGNLDRGGLAFLLSAPLLIYVLWLRYTLVVDMGANLQGRLLLSTAGPIGIGWILGYDGLLRSAAAKRTGIIVGLAMMLAANAAVIACAVALYRS